MIRVLAARDGNTSIAALTPHPLHDHYESKTVLLHRRFRQPTPSGNTPRPPEEIFARLVAAIIQFIAVFLEPSDQF